MAKNQLTFDFYDSIDFTETQELRRIVYELGVSIHEVRKGIFARHNALNRKFEELEKRLQIIEENICKKF